MSQTFFIKARDTAPSLIYALSPASVDLTGATVRFNMRTRTGTVLINRAAAVIVTPTGAPTVRYDWQAGNTDTSGLHEAEFEVTYSGGRIETFPNDSFIGVAVTGDIA
jgi:hypothetical protein